MQEDGERSQREARPPAPGGRQPRGPGRSSKATGASPVPVSPRPRGPPGGENPAPAGTSSSQVGEGPHGRLWRTLHTHNSGHTIHTGRMLKTTGASSSAVNDSPPARARPSEGSNLGWDWKEARPECLHLHFCKLTQQKGGRSAKVISGDAASVGVSLYSKVIVLKSTHGALTVSPLARLAWS